MPRLVDDDVVVVPRRLHLGHRVVAPERQARLVLRPSPLEPLLERLDRGWHDEDEERVGDEPADGARALRIDRQNRVAPGRQDAADLADRRPVPVAVHLGALEQPALVAEPAEARLVHEVVMDPVDLVGPPLPGRRRHDRHDLRLRLRQGTNDRALPHARRPRHDDEERVREGHSDGLGFGAHARREGIGREHHGADRRKARRQVRRKLAPRAQDRAVDRPPQLEPRGMQELAPEPAGPDAAAVAHVPHERQPQEREVGSDLMRPAGERPQ